MNWETLLRWAMRAGAEDLVISFVRFVVTQLKEYAESTDTEVDDFAVELLIRAFRENPPQQ